MKKELETNPRRKKTAVWIPQQTNRMTPKRQKMATRIQAQAKRRFLVVNRKEESERERRRQIPPSPLSNAKSNPQKR